MKMVIKKYSNRRLYDPSKSRYITLEELAESIRKGKTVQVVDAKSGTDLTQVTLTQIILESRGAGKLLPTPILHKLIRLGDDALAEFMGRYVAWALDVYIQARRSMRVIAPLNPLSALFAGGNPFQPLFHRDAAQQGYAPPPMPEVPPEPPEEGEAGTDAGSSATRDEIAALRRELEELRSELTPSSPPSKGKRGK